MRKHHLVMRWVLGTAVFLFVFSALVFPVMMGPNPDLFPSVLRKHSDPLRRNGNMPILYATWFGHDNVGRGRDYLVYEDGWVVALRYWPSGGEGGGDGRYSNTVIRTIHQLSDSLPQGLPSKNAVPHGRMLIISVMRGNKWVTLFYDRQNLPGSVKKLAGMINVHES